MSSDEYPTDEPAVVTCGLPYANGDLHVGHLRSYTAGDAYSRALRKLGQQTAFVSGSDMHGTPIAVGAEQDGVDPETFAMAYHEQYEATFPKFNVEFDNYGHTHDETNIELTREIVSTLEDEGYVYEKEIKVAWDPEEDQPLPDRYVRGTCPYCGETARGDECDEGCGRHLEPGEIEDPVSTITGNSAEYRDREHKFFAVSDLSDYLTEFLDGLEGTSNARNQPREWIESGLQDWCITRDMDWGIDYPGAEDDLVLYVWVDAPIEYVSSTKQYSERVGAETYDWEAVWKPQATDGDGEVDAAAGAPGATDATDADAAGSRNGEIIHVIGRDIIQHHTIFWPAMLHVAGYTAPRAVCATGFVTINGKGLSTSRNRAIWAQEYLDEGFHPDLLRYYLTTMGGFQQDLDFSWERFAERVNGELVGTVGNFFYRSLLFAARNFDGTPEVDVSEDVAERIEAAIDEFRDAVNEYDLREGSEAGVRLARFGNEYIQGHEPWKLEDGGAEQAQVIRDCVQVAKAVAVLVEPFMPEKADRAFAQLGEDVDASEVTLEAATEAPGAFGEPDELFEQVEDERVDELEAALAEKIAAAEDDADDGDADADDGDADDGDADAAETESDDSTASEDASMTDVEPLSEDRISFDEFQAMDLRVGRVEAAEPIEGADKLAKLDVDLGAETRTVVAGIKQLHDLDDLPGTKVVVVANMEQNELFGVESNGMVLAAGEDADLLTTHGDSEPGTKVR
ncbi:methionine--tRNA ligase [Halorubellus sp. JP-L1]|uniref:methionine--tRNA ligase n=1 Tax=Halorubellus sp. JP-L1 TaxID=2715753 RepID=UPI001409D752|nr:methionine--tRNA ligase [Halorubellus sp. JP-L1]NHN42416.1 methionine--tRNA ligase [Halorubellus sp. JP-L1]